jgi:hypothetical protein
MACTMFPVDAVQASLTDVTWIGAPPVERGDLAHRSFMHAQAPRQEQAMRCLDRHAKARLALLPPPSLLEANAATPQAGPVGPTAPRAEQPGRNGERSAFNDE